MKYMNINEFGEFWKLQNTEKSVDSFVDNRPLTVDELVKIRKTIETLEAKHLPSSKIIEALQKMNKKLIQKWRAERVYFTEIKRADTKVVGDLGEELDIDKYRVVLSPHACPVCIDKTNGGQKKFTNRDIDKSGYGHIPPFHPNCYCTVLPL